MGGQHTSPADPGLPLDVNRRPFGDQISKFLAKKVSIWRPQLPSLQMLIGSKFNAAYNGKLTTIA